MSYSYKPAFYPSESNERVHKTLQEIHEGWPDSSLFILVLFPVSSNIFLTIFIRVV